MKTDLLTVPGIGKNIKQDLIDIGIDCVEALRGQDPELRPDRPGQDPRPAEMPVVVLEGARLSFFG